MRTLSSSLRALLVVAVVGVAVSATTANAKPSPSIAVSATTPKVVERGSWSTTRVRITNRTSRTVRGATLSVVLPKGVNARIAGVRSGTRKRAVPALGPKKAITIVVRVRTTAAAARTSKVTVRVARSGRVVAGRTVMVRIADPRVTPGTAGPAGGGATTPSASTATNPLVGRYFYDVASLDEGIVYRAYYFANSRFVYRGTPRGALPACTAVTAVGSGDGCLAYRYTASTREFTIGGVTGSTTGPRSLSLGDVTLLEAVAPGAGRTFATTVWNLCMTDCQTVAFGTDGRFTRTTTAPEDEDAENPVVERGSYRVEAGGRLVLTGDGGSVSTMSILVFLNQSDAPDVQEGLILDGVGFMGPSSGVFEPVIEAGEVEE